MQTITITHCFPLEDADLSHLQMTGEDDDGGSGGVLTPQPHLAEPRHGVRRAAGVFCGGGGRCLDTSGLLAPGKLLLVATLTFEAREPLTFHGLCLSYRVTYVRLTESSQVAAGVTGDGLLGHPGNVYSKVIILLTGWFINRKWSQCWHLRDWNWRIGLINWLRNAQRDWTNQWVCFYCHLWPAASDCSFWKALNNEINENNKTTVMGKS